MKTKRKKTHTEQNIMNISTRAERERSNERKKRKHTHTHRMYKLVMKMSTLVCVMFFLSLISMHCITIFSNAKTPCAVSTYDISNQQKKCAVIIIVVVIFSLSVLCSYSIFFCPLLTLLHAIENFTATFIVFYRIRSK